MRNIFSTCIYPYVKQISAVGPLLVPVMGGDGDRVGVVAVSGEPQTGGGGGYLGQQPGFPGGCYSALALD